MNAVERLRSKYERIDADGRVWRVADVDVDHLITLVEDYDALNNIEYADALRDIFTPVDGSRHDFEEWTPTTWQHHDCVPWNFVTESHSWNGDGRSVVSSSVPAAHQRAAITLNVQRLGGNTRCSGSLVAPNYVLTAAHCISDDLNDAMPPWTITVCREWLDFCVTGTSNPSTNNILSITRPSTYTGASGSAGGTDFDDDWALIELRLDLVLSTDTLLLSNAEDGFLTTLGTVQQTSTPAFFPECAANSALLGNSEPFTPVKSVGAKVVRMAIDNGEGGSGGPFYYCPDGSPSACVGLERGHVFAVQAGWNPVTNRVVGPKLPPIRADLLAIIED